MRKSLILSAATFYILAAKCQPVTQSPVTITEKSNTEYIDPTIGNVGQLLEPTRPIVHLPNQMIRVSPQRKDYLDDQVTSFPLTIVSHRLGEVFSLRPSIKPSSAESWR